MKNTVVMMQDDSIGRNPRTVMSNGYNLPLKISNTKAYYSPSENDGFPYDDNEIVNKSYVDCMAYSSGRVFPIKEVATGLDGIGYKILPCDFLPDDDSTTYNLAYEDDSSVYAIRPTHSNLELFAFLPIPYGYMPKNGIIYGSSTDTCTFREMDIDSSTIVSTLGAEPTGTEATFTVGAVVGSGTNYIHIEVSTNSTSDKIYGGVVEFLPTKAKIKGDYIL